MYFGADLYGSYIEKDIGMIFASDSRRYAEAANIKRLTKDIEQLVVEAAKRGEYEVSVPLLTQEQKDIFVGYGYKILLVTPDDGKEHHLIRW